MKYKSKKTTLERAYNIIKKPITTEKSTNLQQFNQYSFVVSKNSNSIEIKNAVEMIFKVKVNKVNTSILRGKGKTFKGQKLTKISPKKTISGAIGSLILTTIVVSGLIYYFSNNLNIKIIAISIFISLACQSGDLFFSYLKRKAKVKDTSNFLPGHGGVLDRIDGIIVGVPVGYITLTLFY